MNVRSIISFGLCLLGAAVLQMAVLPPLREVVPGWLASLLLWPLLTMVAVVIAMLQGELAGMGAAVLAAVLFGLATDSVYLGPTLVSYALTAFGAGWLARFFRFNRIGWRWLAMVLLMVFEAFFSALVRRMFWSDTQFVIHLPGILVTALIGAVLYAALAPSLKKNLLFDGR